MTVTMTNKFLGYPAFDVPRILISPQFQKVQVKLNSLRTTMEELTSTGSKVQGGVGVQVGGGQWILWQVDLWSGGGDYGANGFSGGGRVVIRALHCTCVGLMTPQRDYSGQSTQLYKPPLRLCVHAKCSCPVAVGQAGDKWYSWGV